MQLLKIVPTNFAPSEMKNVCTYINFVFFSAMFVFYLSGMGVSVCAHRFCSHKAFKATFSARLLLIILQTISGQVKKRENQL